MKKIAEDKVLLGVDYGSKRIGLAISYGYIATPYTVVPNSDAGIGKITDIVKQQNVEKLVIGIPAKKSKMYQQIKKFTNFLIKKIETPYVFWDESLTTIEAEKLLHSKSVKKTPIDALSAAIILQSFIQSKSTNDY